MIEVRVPPAKRLSKRVLLLALWAAVLAIGFWSGSRYPDLDEKAVMGGDTLLEDPLSFEAMIQFEPHAPTWKRVTYTTVNWIDTNKRGMAFGLGVGAAFMSIIRLLRRRSAASALGNTLIGVALGTPLGLCVNCAAPAAKGMHEAGARLETTLAAMVSSPTLNVVVLTMVFAMFPLYLALIKVGLTLVFILAVIPVLSHYAFRSELATTIENGACPAPGVPIDLAAESWPQAIAGAVRDYAASLWFISRTTVPLMLVAGFLGSLLATVVPLENFANFGPGILTVVGVSAVGLFLPVPVAFDVVIAAALLAGGMPVLYVGTLLFVLGIFSCYSTFIVATTISKRVAATLFAVLAVMGVAAGYAADSIHERDLAKLMAFLDAEPLATSQVPERLTALQLPVAVVPIAPAPLPRATEPEIIITKTADRPRSPAADLPFTRREARELGIQIDNELSMDDFWSPFYNGRGLASGDIDQDGWVDLVAATERGVSIFWNQQGERFVAEALDVPGASELNVFLVALVDLDNDGALDLYFATYRSGNYYTLNRAGHFAAENFQQAPTGDVVMTYSAAFGDVDRDGDLDAVLGNWFFGGLARSMPPELARNAIHYNEGGAFRPEPLPGMPGETLTVLLSDWNRDEALDLMVGNDLGQPDIFYLGDGSGGFREIDNRDGIIPTSARTSMSMDTADLNNDLLLDIYITQISARPTREGADVEIEERPFERYCEDIRDRDERRICQHNVDINGFYGYVRDHEPSDIEECAQLSDIAEAQDCKLMMVMKTAFQTRDPRLCARIPEGHRAATICASFFAPNFKAAAEDYKRAIPQLKNENVLLMASPDGSFANRAKDLRAHRTAWSWNGKIADLDNDEWQDIYVVNGMWPRSSTTPSNVFLKNLQGQRFSNLTEEYGLGDHTITTTYTYLDFDNDGDLDVVTSAVNAPAKIYVNNESQNHSISFELRDHRGNRFGIGAKIVIFYGEDDSQSQIRELKAGGGFLSFDAPIAHFGLGAHEQVNRAEIIWPSGERSQIEGPLESGHRHRVERH
jgi:uncharacterized membrane protein YraQ (UPF0718 family)